MQSNFQSIFEVSLLTIPEIILYDAADGVN